jgi:hypothetical protein
MNSWWRGVTSRQLELLKSAMVWQTKSRNDRFRQAFETRVCADTPDKDLPYGPVRTGLSQHFDEFVGDRGA